MYFQVSLLGLGLSSIYLLAAVLFKATYFDAVALPQEIRNDPYTYLTFKERFLAEGFLGDCDAADAECGQGFPERSFNGALRSLRGEGTCYRYFHC